MITNLIRAERKYWLQVRRSILYPLPLLYSPPVVFGTRVEDMTYWQAIASYNEEYRVLMNRYSAALDDLKRRFVQIAEEV